jgi:diaminopimelate epimerase
MAAVTRFVKMHGLSNDFVVVDGPIDPGPSQVIAMCDRRTGIGADGLLAVGRGEHGGAIRMQYWNADGSTAEMCGNGFRCVVRYALDRGLVTKDELVVETPVGLKEARVLPDGDISVDLGPVRVHQATIELRGRPWSTVDVGNPHAVTFVPDLAEAPVTTEGPEIEIDPAFPQGTNVEYVTVNGDRIDMRVWERGVGETQACGSGMVAAATAARLQHPAIDRWQVTVPGGTGSVEFDDDHVWLTGPAVVVFEGVWAQ